MAWRKVRREILPNFYAHLQIIDFPRRFPLPATFTKNPLQVAAIHAEKHTKWLHLAHWSDLHSKELVVATVGMNGLNVNCVKI